MATKVKDINVSGGRHTWRIRIRLDEDTGEFSATFPSVDRETDQTSEQVFKSDRLADLVAQLRTMAVEVDGLAFKPTLQILELGINVVSATEPLPVLDGRALWQSSSGTIGHLSSGLYIEDTPAAHTALVGLTAVWAEMAAMRTAIDRRRKAVQSVLKPYQNGPRFITLDDAAAISKAVTQALVGAT